jgi:hypothetical protein
VKKEKKITMKSKIVLFLFKVVFAYLNIFVASANGDDTVSKTLTGIMADHEVSCVSVCPLLTVVYSGYQFDGVQDGDGNENPVLYNNSTAIRDKGMVLLQNCLDSQRDVPGSHSEAFRSSSHDGDQAVYVKDEELSDVEYGEDPLPMTVV